MDSFQFEDIINNLVGSNTNDMIRHPKKPSSEDIPSISYDSLNEAENVDVISELSGSVLSDSEDSNVSFDDISNFVTKFHNTNDSNISSNRLLKPSLVSSPRYSNKKENRMTMKRSVYGERVEIDVTVSYEVIGNNRLRCLVCGCTCSIVNENGMKHHIKNKHNLQLKSIAKLDNGIPSDLSASHLTVSRVQKLNEGKKTQEMYQYSRSPRDFRMDRANMSFPTSDNISALPTSFNSSVMSTSKLHITMTTSHLYSSNGSSSNSTRTDRVDQVYINNESSRFNIEREVDKRLDYYAVDDWGYSQGNRGTDVEFNRATTFMDGNTILNGSGSSGSSSTNNNINITNANKNVVGLQDFLRASDNNISSGGGITGSNVLTRPMISMNTSESHPSKPFRSFPLTESKQDFRLVSPGNHSNDSRLMETVSNVSIPNHLDDWKKYAVKINHTNFADFKQSNICSVCLVLINNEAAMKQHLLKEHNYGYHDIRTWMINSEIGCTLCKTGFKDERHISHHFKEFHLIPMDVMDQYPSRDMISHSTSSVPGPRKPFSIPPTPSLPPAPPPMIDHRVMMDSQSIQAQMFFTNTSKSNGHSQSQSHLQPQPGDIRRQGSGGIGLNTRNQPSSHLNSSSNPNYNNPLPNDNWKQTFQSVGPNSWKCLRCPVLTMFYDDERCRIHVEQKHSQVFMPYSTNDPSSNVATNNGSANAANANTITVANPVVSAPTVATSTILSRQADQYRSNNVTKQDDFLSQPSSFYWPESNNEILNKHVGFTKLNSDQSVSELTEGNCNNLNKRNKKKGIRVSNLSNFCSECDDGSFKCSLCSKMISEETQMISHLMDCHAINVPRLLQSSSNDNSNSNNQNDHKSNNKSRKNDDNISTTSQDSWRKYFEKPSKGCTICNCLVSSEADMERHYAKKHSYNNGSGNNNGSEDGDENHSNDNHDNNNDSNNHNSNINENEEEQFRQFCVIIESEVRKCFLCRESSIYHNDEECINHFFTEHKDYAEKITSKNSTTTTTTTTAIKSTPELSKDLSTRQLKEITSIPSTFESDLTISNNFFDFMEDPGDDWRLYHINFDDNVKGCGLCRTKHIYSDQDMILHLQQWHRDVKINLSPSSNNTTNKLWYKYYGKISDDTMGCTLCNQAIQDESNMYSHFNTQHLKLLNLQDNDGWKKYFVSLGVGLRKCLVCATPTAFHPIGFRNHFLSKHSNLIKSSTEEVTSPTHGNNNGKTRLICEPREALSSLASKISQKKEVNVEKESSHTKTGHDNNTSLSDLISTAKSAHITASSKLETKLGWRKYWVPLEAGYKGCSICRNKKLERQNDVIHHLKFHHSELWQAMAVDDELHKNTSQMIPSVDDAVRTECLPSSSSSSTSAIPVGSDVWLQYYDTLSSGNKGCTMCNMDFTEEIEMRKHFVDKHRDHQAIPGHLKENQEWKDHVKLIGTKVWKCTACSTTTYFCHEEGYKSHYYSKHYKPKLT